MSVTGAPVSTPRWTFSARCPRISRCQCRASVSVGHIVSNCRPEPGSAGLHQQVDLGIVPQRLVVPHALDRGGDGLEIDDIALVEGDLQPEALFDQLLQDLHLHRAHQLHADLAQQRVPDQMQLRDPPPRARAAGRRPAAASVPSGRRQAVFQHRLQGRRPAPPSHAPRVIAGHRLRQAGHGADGPGRGLLQRA